VAPVEAFVHLTVTPVSLAFPEQQRDQVGLMKAAPDKVSESADVEKADADSGNAIVIQPAPTLSGSATAPSPPPPPPPQPATTTLIAKTNNDAMRTKHCLHPARAMIRIPVSLNLRESLGFIFL
jgi:hypothetical protein